ncbi:hypothetical protein FRC03_002999 [Tulasnella sp. 419]|nr:hypothetical protein FRC03_002999 [Tulasnella sp. 419]
MVPADSTHVVKKRVLDPKTHPNLPTQHPPSPPRMSAKRRMSFQTEQDTKQKIANRRRLS